MFSDRFDAGRRLAEALEQYRGGDAVVLGLARGGVEVGYSVAQALDLPLQALIVRKLGAPQNPELAIGAVSETGDRWLDRHLVELTGASETYIQRETETQIAEARRRKQAYAVAPVPETTQGRSAIVVDDGVATGASALVAVRSARDLDASPVVLAIPVASPQAVNFLRPNVDRLVVLAMPDPFLAVGMHYRAFHQVNDEEVVDLLRRAGRHAGTEHEVQIPCDDVRLRAILTVPPGAKGVVAFAHGSGSGRLSPRNQAVAATLQKAGLATLLADLLMEDEAQDRRLVFDIELLARRLTCCTGFLTADPSTARFPVGYFGASTGAGAALVAAARMGSVVKAVVSRGGRPDLANGWLEGVQAPTLLIVGGEDHPVIELNREAYARIHAVRDLVVVPRATHLFEEPGTLEDVARLARDWFSRYLVP